MNLSKLQKEVRAIATPERAKTNQWFFKTKEGEYGYGDQFLGLSVPQQRIIAKKYKNLILTDIKKLITSKYHEERLIALFILVMQFEKADQKSRKELYDFYISNTKFINNWDLVDSSAPYIAGVYLQDKPKNILTRFAKSKSLWERRIAIIATFAFIRAGKCDETFRIAELLLNDNHDLIHKAVGWMLREVGRHCSRVEEENFLREHYKIMPRTMLRYAIEHFSPERRLQYLQGEV